MKVYHTPQPGFCIGIDIGTTTVSAVVLDITERKTVEVYTIDNASDIASDFVWEKMQDASRISDRVFELLNSLLDRYPEVKTIGITGQMHGILYVDANGSAVSPLYTWQDGRAGLGSPSFCQILEERSGYRLAPGYGLATHVANLMNGNVPNNAVKLCTIMDYIVMKLTAVITQESCRDSRHQTHRNGLGENLRQSDERSTITGELAEERFCLLMGPAGSLQTAHYYGGVNGIHNRHDGSTQRNRNCNHQNLFQNHPSLFQMIIPTVDFGVNGLPVQQINQYNHHPGRKRTGRCTEGCPGSSFRQTD